MKQLTIQQLELSNIAGLGNQTFELRNETSITGRNGSGKTTIAHAIAWLFTGKDLTGSSKWAIKPKGQDGNEKHGLVNQVTAWVNLDGEELAFTKQMQENWERPKASDQYQLTGHNYYYYINNLSYSASEWKQWLTDG
jgi:DNA repair exonuclease SbcCD ATPase subunit